MNVSDEPVKAGGLKKLFISVGEATVKIAKKVANNTVRALEVANIIDISIASKIKLEYCFQLSI